MLTHSELYSTAAIYQLLSRLWQREVDEQLLAAMRDGELADALFEIIGQPTLGGESPLRDAVAVDFCQLFLGPVGHLPPYQSVWVQGAFQGKAASAMRRWLDQYAPGYVRPEGLAADHLAVQLDVMASILQTGNQAKLAVDQAASMELAEHFFRDHILWSSRLIDIAGERARTDFYRGVMALTRAFLTMQREAIIVRQVCDKC